MKPEVLNQFTFKGNELTLQQDINLLNSLGSDFENEIRTKQRLLQNEMVSLCHKFNSKAQKKQYDACITFNTKLADQYRKFSSYFIDEIQEKSRFCRRVSMEKHQKLNSNKGFKTIVQFQRMIDKQSQTLKQQAMRIKSKQFTLQDLK